MGGDLGFDHVALALANHFHIDGPRIESPPVFRSVAHEMRDPRACDLVFARQAGDVGAGASDPFAFNGCCALTRLRHVPGDELAAGSAAKNQDVVPLRLGHILNPVSFALTRRILGRRLDDHVRKSRMLSAISWACVSKAKWPVSKKRTTARGLSRLNASAPGGKKNGSFLPQTAKSGGLCVRKYSWNDGYRATLLL